MTTRAWPDLLRTVASAALGVAIVAGATFLWIGIPVLGFWLAGELTTTAEGYLFFVLPGVPAAMVAFGWLLYRLNSVYVRFTGAGPAGSAPSRSRWLGSLSDERDSARRQRAPRSLIDVAMTISAVTALVLLFVWFFLLAGSPLGPMD